MTTNTLQFAIADSANSPSDSLAQATDVVIGTTVKSVFEAKGITVRSGQKVSLNGIDISVDAQLQIGGLLSVTGEAKGA
jgi:hypothetical protein